MKLAQFLVFGAVLMICGALGFGDLIRADSLAANRVGDSEAATIVGGDTSPTANMAVSDCGSVAVENCGIPCSYGSYLVSCADTPTTAWGTASCSTSDGESCGSCQAYAYGDCLASSQDSANN